MLHSFANNQAALGFEEDSVLSKFVNKLKDETPLKRGELLNDDVIINDLHNQLASEGQTKVEEGKVGSHFVCFTAVNGHLFELDGTKSGPVDHGEIKGSDLLHAAAEKIKETYIQPNPTVLEFSMIGLS